jgi:hypothetical protein
MPFKYLASSKTFLFLCPSTVGISLGGIDTEEPEEMEEAEVTQESEDAEELHSVASVPSVALKDAL